MQNFIKGFVSGLFTFIIGVTAASLETGFSDILPHTADPLRARIVSFNTTNDYTRQTGVPYELNVVVNNTSDKTISGYTLVFEGKNHRWFALPKPNHQTLSPGGSQPRNIPSPVTNAKIRVDFVNFTDGTVWGANETHSEIYIAE